jgi:hypothetical protein
MSNDRVERVARALCKADGNDPDAHVPTGRMILTDNRGPEFCFAGPITKKKRSDSLQLSTRRSFSRLRPTSCAMLGP